MAGIQAGLVASIWPIECSIHDSEFQDTGLKSSHTGICWNHHTGSWKKLRYGRLQPHQLPDAQGSQSKTFPPCPSCYLVSETNRGINGKSTGPWEIYHCFKLLNSGVVCHVAINSWYIKVGLVFPFTSFLSTAANFILQMSLFTCFFYKFYFYFPR